MVVGWVVVGAVAYDMSRDVKAYNQFFGGLAERRALDHARKVASWQDDPMNYASDVISWTVFADPEVARTADIQALQERLAAYYANGGTLNEISHGVQLHEELVKSRPDWTYKRCRKVMRGVRARDKAAAKAAAKAAGTAVSIADVWVQQDP